MSFLIYHNLGLGDHIVCNGMVRHFAESSDVYLFSKQKNYYSVKTMYSDNSRITVVPVVDDEDAKEKYANWNIIKIAVGCANPEWNPNSNTPFDVIFYEQAGIPHDYRWSKFLCAHDHMVSNPTGDYAFIHDDVARGYTIKAKPMMPIVRPSTEEFAIADWFAVLANAKEIHCINSAFLILADQVKTTGRLYWHKYARNEGALCNPTVRKTWTIIE